MSSYAWPVPKTINDKNEFGIPRIKIYVTADELRFVIAGLAMCFFGGFALEAFFHVKYATVVGLGLSIPCAALIWIFFGTYRLRKHPAYLWNLYHRLGAENGKRGIVSYRRGRQIRVGWWTQGQPSTWKSGDRKVFTSAHQSLPWQRMRPPLCPHPPVQVPYRTQDGPRRHPDLAELSKESSSAFGQ